MSDYTTMQHLWSRLVARGTVTMLLCGGLAVPVAPAAAVSSATTTTPSALDGSWGDRPLLESMDSNARTINPSHQWRQQSIQQLALRFPRTEPRSGSVSSIGGGTRGEACFPTAQGTTAQQSLTLLLPLSREGESMSANPTVFVFVPTTVVRTAELFVADQAGNVLDRQLVTLTGKSGIVKLPMLSRGKSLQLGKTYNWAFSIICDPIDRSSDLNAIGSIKRVEPSEEVKQRLMNARDPLQKAEVLAEAKLWYDTLATAAALKDSQPDQWRSLLESAGLQEVSGANFTELGR